MSTKPSVIMASRLAIGLAALALAGCQNHRVAERDPLPYSPNYHVAKASGPVRKGYDTQSGRLVPDACVTPDVTEDPMYLPPGCANNVNLQMMVERESDLVQGRQTGPAMAEPVVRAARRVIDGTTPEQQRSARESEVNTTGSME
jgi:type IV pilus biogenesis protein CpaD/CtpE